MQPQTSRGLARARRWKDPTVRTRSKAMVKKPARTMVLVSLVVLVFAVWGLGTATGKQKKGKSPVLPKAAAAAIKKAFPKATIDEIELEKEGVVLYEVELEQGGKELEVTVSPDGQIVEVERKVSKADLPDAVAKTLARLAGDAKIKEIEKEEIHAVVKLVKLRKPKTVYEAEFVKDGKEIEVKIAADGTLLSEEIEEEGDDDDDEDEEGEKEISLDEVPAAVKATILKEAGGKKIKEVEVETRGGKTTYEAEWTVGGKDIEIKVAPDGKLLSKETEDEDDDD